MEINGGGWTVLLKRQDGSVDFHLNWADYKNGFGNFEGEHWLGLENMYLLTNLSGVTAQLRVDLADWEGNTALPSMTNSQLVMRTVTTPSLYRGTSLPVQLETHLHLTIMNRASAQLIETMILGLITVFFQGSWWYNACYYNFLIGKYFNSGGPRSSPQYGIIWSTWTGFDYSLCYADMKIRPGGV